ncbi:hypothetical protein [Streptomyces sp. NPDC020965]|uniref:hypothetical protein n=1 Tax=Streptomyces sp. NPDC020965 TaxID=3365105 RepID=UPI0037A86BC6
MEAMEADAARMEDSAPAQSAHLYETMSRHLADSNFPGHAEQMRRRQASAARAAGEAQASFAILADLAVKKIHSGSTDSRFPERDFGDLAVEIGGAAQAKYAVLSAIADWYGRGTRLSDTIPALEELVAAREPDAGLLCCLVLEQAVVDN